MFKKKPIIKYESAIPTYPDIFSPAVKHVPDWYKKIPKYKDNEIFTMERGFKFTVKNCVPFLDSLTTGYMILLPFDLYVKNNNGSPYLTWKYAEFTPEWRDSVADDNLVPHGHFPREYTWKVGVANTIPTGFSMLLTHPLNRHDLPFTTLSGIVDGGLVLNPLGNIPFYIKNGFEGVIPQGTPIIQVIPFRQENWLSKKTKGLVQKGYEHNVKTLSVFTGWYKKTFWTRKKYD